MCRAVPVDYYVNRLVLSRYRPPGFPEHTRQEEEVQVTHLHLEDRSYGDPAALLGMYAETNT